MTDFHAKISLNRQFLHALLISSIVGSAINVSISLYFQTRPVLMVVNIVIFLGLVVGYLTTKFFHKETLAVFIITFIVLLAIVYWFFVSSGYFGGVTIAVIMVLGYTYSLTLSRKVRTFAHLFIFVLLAFLLVYQILHISSFNYITNPNSENILATGVPYLILYLLITISSSVLRDRYEKANDALFSKNQEINIMNTEISAQNEELTAQREEMKDINGHLEQLVEKRTLSLKAKTDQLEEYSFKNAHNVRGSLARILGLIYLKKIKADLSDEEFLDLLDKESHIMDDTLKQLSIDLYRSMKE
jgi:signal transduction histidine kinase